jgi:hypothetical protein
MKALVLERKDELNLRDFPSRRSLGRGMSGLHSARSESAAAMCTTIPMVPSAHSWSRNR